MSGKKKKKMAKKKLKTWSNYTPEAGEVNEEKSLTMPDMQNDPRTVLENHVRGINPITGAVLDNALYYGDAILPYAKDLTFEELRIKRQALESKLADLNEKIQAASVEEPSQSSDGLEGNESSGETTNS
jgi:hypothetical protein